MRKLIGLKVKMSQIFIPDGGVVPVTLIRLESLDGIEEGSLVEVMGYSKGKGFAGVVKRYHFKGGPATHGQSDRERAPGSIGGTTTPGRVYKGKRLPGRLGKGRVTIKGLKVVALDKEQGTISVSGSVPGPIKGKLVVRVRENGAEK